MTFKVIDTKTGKPPTSRVIDNIAKKNGLMEMDIDQFYVGEDGELILADECGKIAYCDTKRFKVVLNDCQLDLMDMIVEWGSMKGVSHELGESDTQKKNKGTATTEECQRHHESPAQR